MDRNSPAAPSTRILVLGDDGLDTYVYGTIDRLSPEAPVPVFVPKTKTVSSGMARNVRDNVTAFGLEVIYRCGKTSHKTRYVEMRSKHHLLRLDEDVVSQPLVVEEDLSSFAGIVISDYNKGTITKELVSDLRSRFDGFMIMDTKKTDLGDMDGVLFKINKSEYDRLIVRPKEMIVTQGSDPVLYFGEQTFEVPVPLVDVHDVTGAGDTFLAALAYGLSHRWDIVTCMTKASMAATITIQKPGTYCPTWKEVDEYFSHR